MSEKNCPKCGTTMRYGYLAEQDMNEIIPISFGTAWKPAKTGLITLKVAETIAYACPDCGYIEQYVKYIEKDREKILLAPSSYNK